MKATFGQRAIQARHRIVAAIVTSLAALVVAGVAYSAGPATGGRSDSPRLSEPWTLSQSCAKSKSFDAACRIVISFFRAANSGQFDRACSLLGSRLRFETGGPGCPRVVSNAGPQRYGILGVRRLNDGVGVLVSLDFGELDHVRQLRWMASVGREAGRLKILHTQRW